MSSIRNAFGALQAEYGFQGGNRVNQEENAVGLIKDFESRSKTVSDLRAELLSNYSMWVKCAASRQNRMTTSATSHCI